MRRTSLGWLSTAVHLLTIACAGPVLAQEPPSGGRWTWAVEPYLWLPGADGTLRYDIPSNGGGGADAGLSIDDLSLALMVNVEARKGDWSVVFDAAYVDFDSDESEVNSVRFAGPGGQVEATVAVETTGGSSLTGMEWAVAGGTTVVRGGGASLDLIGGVRAFTIEATTSWRLAAEVVGPGPGQVFAQAGTVSKRVELWDGIVGLRGALGATGGRWSFPFYLDLGTGSSALTWQAVVGFACRLSWGDLHLAYRHMAYDMGDDGLLQDFSISGPAFGARFRF